MLNNQMCMLDAIYYYIDVDEMLRRPWVCEKLSCHFGGLQ